MDIISQIAELERVIEAEEKHLTRPKPKPPGTTFTLKHSGQVLFHINNFEDSENEGKGGRVDSDSSS